MKYKSLLDIELISLVKEVDKEALVELFERYYPVLFLFAYRNTLDDDNANDLVQDFFVDMWENRAKIEIVEDFERVFYKGVSDRIDKHLLQINRARLSQPILYEDACHSDNLTEEGTLDKLIKVELEALPKGTYKEYLKVRKLNLHPATIPIFLDKS